MLSLPEETLVLMLSVDIDQLFCQLSKLRERHRLIIDPDLGALFGDLPSDQKHPVLDLDL